MSQILEKKNGDFIPIWQYCKEKGIDKQKVYRWIREGKIPSDKLKKIEKIVQRLLIDRNV